MSKSTLAEYQGHGQTSRVALVSRLRGDAIKVSSSRMRDAATTRAASRIRQIQGENSRAPSPR